VKPSAPFVLLAFLMSAGPAFATDPRPCRTLADAIRANFEADADLDRVHSRLAAGPAWRVDGAELSGSPRRLQIGRARYRALFAAPTTEAGFAPASTRTIELRRADGGGRAICRLRLVGESTGRISDMRPADTAAEFARRAPMGLLEPVLPALARATLAAPGVDLAGLTGPGSETAYDGSLAFSAGGARFQVSLVPLPGSGDEVQATLVRLMPELGNRGRPLGTFRYTVATRLAQIDVE
jgi:hypothetical protein